MERMCVCWGGVGLRSRRWMWKDRDDKSYMRWKEKEKRHLKRDG